MKLIKLSHDHYTVVDKEGLEIASTKPTDSTIKLDLFEVRQLVSTVSKIPEHLKSMFETEDMSLVPEATLVYTMGYDKAMYHNREKKYTKEDLRQVIHEARSHHERTSEEIVEALEPKQSWNVELVDRKLKLEDFGSKTSIQ